MHDSDNQGSSLSLSQSHKQHHSRALKQALIKRRQKQRKHYDLQRQFNEKSSIVPGCSGALIACMSTANCKLPGCQQQPHQHLWIVAAAQSQFLRPLTPQLVV